MSDAGLPDNVVRLISGGKEGKLTTPAGEQVPVRVFERGDQLVLVLMLEAGEDLEQASGEPLSLEYVSTRGLIRFSGEATLEGRDLSYLLPMMPIAVLVPSAAIFSNIRSTLSRPPGKLPCTIPLRQLWKARLPITMKGRSLYW